MAAFRDGIEAMPDQVPTEATGRTSSLARRIARAAARVVAGVALVLWWVWCALSLWFANLSLESLRSALASSFVAASLLLVAIVRPRRRKLIAVVGLNAIVTACYFADRPSNDRDWQPDVAVTPSAEIAGDRVAIRGVRNFRYRSESDFDERWEERIYDLSKLRSLDLVMCFWDPVDYCHTMLSFGFEGGDQLVASVEARKERGEQYSTFGGFFRQYELVYVFGDERDLIALRTNHRGEDVYLYRLRVRPHRLRELFLSYVRFADEISRDPQYYGVLANSCGVNVLHRVAETGVTLFAGRDALLNGYWDRHFYDYGAIDRSLPFDELRRSSRINDRARAAADSPDFSRRIREGLPTPPPFPE
jgi:hypothetical protein